MLHQHLSQLPFGQTTIRTTSVTIPGMPETAPFMTIEMMILPPSPFPTGRKISITSNTKATITPMGSVTTTETTITVMPKLPFEEMNFEEDFDTGYDPMGYGMPDLRDLDFSAMDGFGPMDGEPVREWRVTPFEPEPMAPTPMRHPLLKKLDQIRAKYGKAGS